MKNSNIKSILLKNKEKKQNWKQKISKKLICVAKNAINMQVNKLILKNKTLIKKPHLPIRAPS
jgi:hypothetical protein